MHASVKRSVIYDNEETVSHTGLCCALNNSPRGNNVLIPKPVILAASMVEGTL